MALLKLGLLLAFPIVEIVLLVVAGQHLGLLRLIAIILGTGLAGAFILSRHGMTTARQVQAAAERGESVAAPMLEAALLGVSGLLLISPGLLCDLAGLLLMLPPLRRWAARAMVARAAAEGAVNVEIFEMGEPPLRRQASPRSGSERSGTVIEGEFERVSERPVGPDGSAEPSRGPGALQGDTAHGSREASPAEPPGHSSNTAQRRDR